MTKGTATCSSKSSSGPDLWWAVNGYVDGPLSERETAWQDVVIAELARHIMEARGDEHGRCSVAGACIERLTVRPFGQASVKTRPTTPIGSGQPRSRPQWPQSTLGTPRDGARLARGVPSERRAPRGPVLPCPITLRGRAALPPVSAMPPPQLPARPDPSSEVPGIGSPGHFSASRLVDGHRYTTGRPRAGGVASGARLRGRGSSVDGGPSTMGDARKIVGARRHGVPLTRQECEVLAVLARGRAGGPGGG